MSEIQIIIPNLNARFSGITSTVSRVVPVQEKSFHFASVGHVLPFAIEHLSWWRLFRLTGKTLSNGRPRIFHARRNIEMLAGLILKKIFRRKIYLVFTSVAQRQHTWFTRFLYRRMDSVISTSPRSASFLKRKVDAIIPHGTDTSLYHPTEDRRKLWKEGGLPGEYGIGIFGRVRPQKGVREFVEALCEVLPRHPDFTAVIIGETTPKFRGFEEGLKQQIRERGLEGRFCWMGKLPFADIPLWFRRMSLVAAISHNEGFGLTCLEAMASGAPVIGTPTGAFDMIIREGIDGCIVPTKDSRALAECLDRLLSNPEKLDEMGRAACRHVSEDFSIEKEAESLNQYYQDVFDGKYDG